MKFTISLISVAVLGNVACSPLSSSDHPLGLEGRSTKKCHWKDKSCCVSLENGHNYKRDSGHDHDHEYSKRRTIHVKDGQSIQKAIEKASPGDRIDVDAGTYKEQLTINKDGIELVGHGAVLVPPAKATKNPCSGLSGPGTQAGICVAGSGVKLADFVVEHCKVLSVAKPVKGVSITGFEVRKFSGINIAILGARTARVVNNKLTDGGKYGSLTAGSFNTLVSGNEVSSSAELSPGIAICMDNLSGVLVSQDKVSKHGVGLCVQTDGAQVEYNHVTSCCAGVFVDPGVKGAKIRHNYVGSSNSNCGGAGVILDGTVDAEVQDNTIEGQKGDGKGAGLVVVDDDCPLTGPGVSLSCLALKHKAVSSGNEIIRNTLRNNDYDIFVNTTGSQNVVKCNTCSLPANICGK